MGVSTRSPGVPAQPAVRQLRSVNLTAPCADVADCILSRSSATLPYAKDSGLCARIRQSPRFYWVSVKGCFPLPRTCGGTGIVLEPMLVEVPEVSRPTQGRP